MVKTSNNKNSESAPPPNLKNGSNKINKKGKEQQTEIIIIKKIKANNEPSKKKIKTLASDHFSASAGKNEMKEQEPRAEKVSILHVDVFY